MNDHKLQSLREEYAKLFSLMEKYLTMPYSVIPLGVTLIAALTLYGNTDKDYKGLLGVAVCYGMVLLVIWQSYIHSSMNWTGLRLVELECRINAATGARPEEGLGVFSSNLATGYENIPGLASTTAIAIIFGLAVYCGAAVLGWCDLHERLHICIFCCWLLIGFPLIVMVALLVIMGLVERKTGLKKRELLIRLRSTTGKSA